MTMVNSVMKGLSVQAVLRVWVCMNQSLVRDTLNRILTSAVVCNSSATTFY